MAAEYVGIDLHRRRSVIVRQDGAGETLERVRIDNDPVALALAIEKAGPDAEVVVEATYGWYWAVDVLQAAGAKVNLAHPLGVKGWAHRRVKLGLQPRPQRDQLGAVAHQLSQLAQLGGAIHASGSRFRRSKSARAPASISSFFIAMWSCKKSIS